MITLTVGSNDDGTTRINRKHRFKHIYVLGKTQQGKTSLLKNWFYRDSFSDFALIFLDPTGDETDNLLGIIDPSRLIKLCSLEYPITLNPFALPFRKAVLIDNVIDIIDQAISFATGQVKLTGAMRRVINRAIEIQDKPSIPGLVQAIPRVMGTLGRQDRESAERVLHRLEMMVGDPAIKPLLQGKPLNWSRFLHYGGILLVNCRGLTNEQMLLIGNILVKSITCFYMNIKLDEYPELAFYIDEFHNFVSPNMSRLLREAAKKKVSMIFSHQDMAFTRGNHSAAQVVHTIKSNVGSIVCFNVGSFEAKTIAEEFINYRPSDFISLEKHHCICKIGVEESKVKTRRPPSPDEYQLAEMKRRLKPKQPKQQPEQPEHQPEQPFSLRFQWV